MTLTQRIVSIIFILALFPYSQAQQPPKKQSPKTYPPTVSEQENIITAQNRLLAVQRVRALADRAMKFQDLKLKIRTLIGIGDILWGKGNDVEYARALFLKLFDLLRSTETPSSKKDIDNKNAGGVEKTLSPIEIRYLHTLLVQSLARHDPAMAKSLSNDNKLATDGDLNLTYSQNIGIAINLLKEGEAATAIDYAKEGLKGDLTGLSRLLEIITFLNRLRINDKQSADRLYLQVLSQIINEQKVDADDVLIIGNYLFTGHNVLAGTQASTQVFISPTRVGNIGLQADVAVDRPDISPVIIRAYLIAAINILDRTKSDPDAQSRNFAAAYLLLPKAKSFAPDLVPRLSAIANNAGVAPQDPANMTTKTLPDTSLDKLDLDTILRKADDIQGDRSRDEYCLRAVKIFYLRDDYNAARKITDKMQYLPVREKLLKLIDFRQAAKSLERGEVNIAEQVASKLAPGLQRVLLRLGVARVYAKNGDGVSAHAAITAAVKDAHSSLTGAQQAYSLLAAAEIVAQTDTVAGATILEEAVHSFNALDTKPLEQPQTGTVEIVKIGNQSVAFEINVAGVYLGDFHKALEPLAIADATRTEATVLELENEKVLSQGILALSAALFK